MRFPSRGAGAAGHRRVPSDAPPCVNVPDVVSGAVTPVPPPASPGARRMAAQHSGGWGGAKESRNNRTAMPTGGPSRAHTLGAACSVAYCPASSAQCHYAYIQQHPAAAGGHYSLAGGAAPANQNAGRHTLCRMDCTHYHNPNVAGQNRSPPAAADPNQQNQNGGGVEQNNILLAGDWAGGEAPGLAVPQPAAASDSTAELPDILNSHLPPPYSPPRPPQRRGSAGGGAPPGGHRGGASTSMARSMGATLLRHLSNAGRGRRRDGGGSGVVSSTQLVDRVRTKACCSVDCVRGCLTLVTTFRWVLAGLALLGVGCVVTGVVLGALHMTAAGASSYLTLSLMFIGLGVMLVVVVGVGWRCTPPGHEPCHLLFHLGDFSTDQRRRRGDRNSHWYGGVLYPEFRYRRPPPSYSVSMQEYQQQVALAQLQPAAAAPPPGSPPGSPPGGAVPAPESPPPTYRSRPGTLRPGVHITFPRLADQPASRPPTYRATQPHDRPAIPHDMAAQPPQPPKPTPSPQPDREVGLVVDHRGASFLMEQNAPTTSASVSSRATTALTEAGAAFSRLLSRGQSLPRRAATLHVDRGHARAVTADRRTATLPHQPNAAAPGNHRTTAANAALYTPPQYHRSTSDCPENGRLQYHRSTSDCPDCSRLHRFISDCPEGGRLQRLVSCDCHMRGGGGGGGMYAEAPRIVMPRQSASMDDNLQNCHNEAIRYGYLAAEGRVTPGDGTLQRNAVQYLDGVLSDIEGQGACRDCQAGDDVAAGDNRAFASSSASRENMASRGECDADECCCNQGSRERVMDTEF